MINIKHPVNGKKLKVDRVIRKVRGTNPGPCVVFFAGIHGNEPSGIFAFDKIANELIKVKEHVKGSVIGISGNLWALQKGKRYQKYDLNRLWSNVNIQALSKGQFTPSNEDEKQLEELFETVHTILIEESGPFYFFDLHTTSGETPPFITVNDSLLNRKFTELYPLPLILGIEEYLDGPLLSYINDLGYVSFGFEGGQHDSIESIKNHESFIAVSLVFASVIDKKHIDFDGHFNNLKQESNTAHSFFEIYERYALNEDDSFEMKPGYRNFDRISKGDHLASHNTKKIRAQQNSTLFMPLYQSQGNDGFFLVRKTPSFFLWLSKVLRKLKADRIFPILPGVSWASKDRSKMKVNLTIARFITKQLFHLFGYRSKISDNNELIIANREYNSKKTDYFASKWYKGEITTDPNN